MLENTYKNLNAVATTTVKSSGGYLHSIVVGDAGSADSLITVYDNTAGSGTIIGKIKGDAKGTYIFDVSFNTGLTVVISGTTAPNITVSYH